LRTVEAVIVRFRNGRKRRRGDFEREGKEKGIGIEMLLGWTAQKRLNKSPSRPSQCRAWELGSSGAGA
jgi:hypothetical protein